ncbi:DEAD/DEAH box helicase [Aequorivita sp. KMM 9714]|uniref:DEAD/DEAH box helicase n=1 Tax=Aequorivita sp. KMM 9714 TaxID=2707173 RepID=UPI0013EC9ECC|nr:DEAD/DEAH box helicase [Aequorivita sp. KMM 9714]NGX83984.1 DEAD/DEAH box helicase [Aequorivita sp. KMM 9714]
MANEIKDQQDILAKLNISALNPMQEKAIETINNNSNTILLSPTGTGKTLAFLLPILDSLNVDNPEVQALIVVPTRELAIQIEQVVRNMGSGFKVNAVYGGRSKSKDKIELKHTPAILIGTPGRILDHFDDDRFSKASINTLVLDEYDKSLEIGFESEMSEILSELNNVSKRILTSATQGVGVPKFVNLTNPIVLDFLTETSDPKLSIKTVVSEEKNKLQTLLNLVKYLGNQPGIIFCNFRESIDMVSDFLNDNRVSHTCFSGGMEQKDRERALIKFRNGTSQILVSTDLAARGIDIPELKYIIHYELPHSAVEFTHRNGRTARVNEKGTAYVLKWKNQLLPDFIEKTDPIEIPRVTSQVQQQLETLFISGGRKDKISKGDIAGLFIKQGNISQEQLGNIELKQDCAFVAVPLELADDLVNKLNNSRLKKKKVRIYIL